MTFLAHIADRALNRPLLISPDKAAVIVGVLAGRIGLGEIEANRFEGDGVPKRDAEGNVKRNMWGDPELEPFKLSNGVGIISITGSLVNRGAWVGAYSGLTSYEGIQHQLKRAAANADVKSILLDLHTPGGEAVGAFETAAMVREVAKSKRVVAVVNGMAASAGYAIASGASEIVVTESGIAGSIGVVWLHADYSRYLENEGIKPTLIFAGSHKVDGHPFGPLPDTVKADIQGEIDAVYAQFIKTVASGRGERLSADAARSTEARTFAGEAAVQQGLADRIGTFETALADLSRAHSPTSGGGRTTSHVKGTRMSETNDAPAVETNAGISQAQVNDAVAAALTADRTRMADLDELGGMVAGNADGEKIVREAKASGATAAETALKLARAGAFKKAASLAALAADDEGAAGAAPAAAADGNAAKVDEKTATREQLVAAWNAAPEGSALRKNYLTAESYASAILFDRK
jgi:signal peptide peptidase SppA